MIIFVPAILYPFTYVTGGVVKPKGIWLKGSYGLRPSGMPPDAAAHTIGYTWSHLFAPPIRCLGPCSGCVFPLASVDKEECTVCHGFAAWIGCGFAEKAAIELNQKGFADDRVRG